MAKSRRGNNEGSATKRKDGTWQTSCITGYDDAGKPKRKYFYGKTKGEALKKMQAVNEVVKETGSFEEDKTLTVAGWLDRWLTEYKTNSLKPNTFENYEEKIRVHINPAIGGIKLNKLTTSDVQTLYNAKQADGGRRDNQDGALSLSTVRYIHTILNQALNKARDLNLMRSNPCDQTEIKKEGAPREIKHLDSEGLTALLERVRDSKHYPAYLLAIASGLRRGELLGLRWQDVNFNDGSITVNQTLTTTKANGLYFGSPKTKYGRRTVEIPDDAMAELRKHKKDKMNTGCCSAKYPIHRITTLYSARKMSARIVLLLSAGSLSVSQKRQDWKE